MLLIHRLILQYILTQWEKLELNTNPNALPGQQLSVAGVPCS